MGEGGGSVRRLGLAAMLVLAATAAARGCAASPPD
jgi:hypothetical protein